MPQHYKKKRSRDDHRHKQKREVINNIQKQLDNLTKVMEMLVQKEQNPPNKFAEIEKNDTEIIVSKAPYERIFSKEALFRLNLNHFIRMLGVSVHTILTG